MMIAVNIIVNDLLCILILLVAIPAVERTLNPFSELFYIDNAGWVSMYATCSTFGRLTSSMLRLRRYASSSNAKTLSA